jgi:hypothetical protein
LRVALFVVQGQRHKEKCMTVTSTTDLDAVRGHLVVDVEDGVEGAAEALAEIEAQIVTANRDAERAALAEAERSRRRAAEADAHAEAATAAAKAKLPELARQSAELGDVIDRSLADLVAAITGFRALDNQMRIVARAAGASMSDHRAAGLKQRMLGEVAKAFPHNHEHVFANPSGETFGAAHRRSLGHLLDEAPAPAE